LGYKYFIMENMLCQVKQKDTREGARPGRGFLLCKKNFGTAYASNPRTPKAHTSLRGTPDADNGFASFANSIQGKALK
jgi:hypothetical protein